MNAVTDRAETHQNTQQGMSTSIKKSKANKMLRPGAGHTPHQHAAVPAPVKVPGRTSAKAAVKSAVKVVVAKSKPAAKTSARTGTKGGTKRSGTGNAPAATPRSKAKAAAVVVKAVGRPAARKATPRTRDPAGKTAGRAQARLKLVAAEPASLPPAKDKPMVAAPRRLRDKVRIFHIYYRPEQRQFLDPAFEPYNNEGDNSPLLEFNVFRKLMNSALVQGAELWGAVSWKFKEKTGLGGEQLRQIIASNPGHDVYYCNPFSELEGLYHNLWLQGETSHPNFLILCRDFFQAAGLDESQLTQFVPSSHFAASNYFVATPEFWQGYAGFISDAIARAERGMSATAKAMIYSAAADRKAMHAGASYMPFIVERLFGVYLNHAQGQYKAHKFVCEQQEAKLNVHLRLLRQMKDVAINSKSLWMATCWVNYRNVYMQQLHGADWCTRYLRDITPVQVKF